MVLFLTLKGQDTAPVGEEEKTNEMFFLQIEKLPLLMQSVSRFGNCVQTLSPTVASYDARITNIEQLVNSLAARVTILETNAAFASSGSGSARSWNILGHCDGSTATRSLGSHGPGSSDDIETRDVDLILSQALKMNMHEVPSYYGSRENNTTLRLTNWINSVRENPTCQLITNLSEFIAKQVPYQPGLYSKQEPKVRTLWPDIEMVSLLKLIVHSANADPISQSVSAH